MNSQNQYLNIYNVINKGLGTGGGHGGSYPQFSNFSPYLMNDKLNPIFGPRFQVLPLP